jgi:hypothetical protein
MILNTEKILFHATKIKQPFTIRCHLAMTSNYQTTMFISLTVIPTHIVSYKNISIELRNLTHKCFTNDELLQPT